MCICVYVCIYIYIYIYTYIHTLHTYIYIYIYNTSDRGRDRRRGFQEKGNIVANLRRGFKQTKKRPVGASTSPTINSNGGSISSSFNEKKKHAVWLTTKASCGIRPRGSSDEMS